MEKDELCWNAIHYMSDIVNEIKYSLQIQLDTQFIFTYFCIKGLWVQVNIGSFANNSLNKKIISHLVRDTDKFYKR